MTNASHMKFDVYMLEVAAFGARSAPFGARNAPFGATFGARSAAFGVRNAPFGARNPQLVPEMQGSGLRTPDSGLGT